MRETGNNEIVIKNNRTITVEKRGNGDRREVSITMKSRENCRLHWGLSKAVDSSWVVPSNSMWPPGSIAFKESAVQTPFLLENGENRVTIHLDNSVHLSVLNFALYYPDRDMWDSNNGRNYHIILPKGKRAELSLQELRDRSVTEGEVLYEVEYDLDGEGKLITVVMKENDLLQVLFITDVPGTLLLHWGTAVNSPFEWTLPVESYRPQGSKKYDDKAVQTPFTSNKDLNQLIVSFSQKEAPMGIPFALTFSSRERWLKDRGGNFYVPLGELLQKNGYPGPPRFSQVAREIIEAETGRNSWTLMHRFHLCHDLLDRVGRDEEGLALLFVWLRYSFLRQLDWQRNYNTKPKELSHAQDRLTVKLAGLYSSGQGSSELIRLLLATLGRGGEGQRIRDEILHIMHRHRIKEVSGHFLEEWHQKLHNNTTPDDIEICRAYLEFLKSDGNLELFYRTLEAGGVTKERLEHFERPIVTPPDFIPHLKDALIYDFQNYLKLFMSVHSGTDLESSADAARYLFDDEINGGIHFILQHRNDPMMPVEEIIGAVTSLRSRFSSMIDRENDHGRVRDILYLDIALEEFLRVVVEGVINRSMDKDRVVELIGAVLRNEGYSRGNVEIAECSRHWDRLMGIPRFSQDWALHAKSVLDRLSRAIADMSDSFYGLFQDKAVYMGKAFRAEAWTVSIFSEEIVRGRLSFLLSLLVHHLDPLLRKKAKLGDWQVISPGQATGVVEVVESLSLVQDRTFEKPTLIIAENVKGDEEPPEGVKAVITPDLVDLVAHVAIRARNAGILFATCYDRGVFKQMQSLKGQSLALAVNASGDVVIEKSADAAAVEPEGIKTELKETIRPASSGFALSSTDFLEQLVGGKSLNLKYLQERVPDWIHIPSSAALPFGVFEKVMAMDINKRVAARYNDLVKGSGKHRREDLSAIREVLLELEAPGELLSSLRKVMEQSGLGWPEKEDEAWLCIKKVWASKWNQRACVSRSARGIPDEDLFMAVLIQQVVEAEYAFVIHTVNPLSGDGGELYAEVVAGLGETLVGNYPGRALGFTSGKSTPAPVLTAYPSKSIGLFGGGLIFRSDSNGEDLGDYAGAGLYDSFLLEPAREVVLKSSGEPLVWDEGFRKDLLRGIANVAITIEKIMGSPQDIEGAYAGGNYYVVQTRPQV